MNAEDFTRMIIESYQIGFMEAMRAYEPSNDLVKASEVKSWLKMMHIEQKKFKQLCDSGKMKIIRKGNSKNSPIYYSKSEIKKALFTTKVTALYELEKEI